MTGHFPKSTATASGASRGVEGAERFLECLIGLGEAAIRSGKRVCYFVAAVLCQWPSESAHTRPSNLATDAGIQRWRPRELPGK